VRGAARPPAEGGVQDGAMFSGIVGQDRATVALGRAVRERRLVPSLIFHGPAGVGKLSTALEFCRALLCSAPGGNAPCRRCATCRRIEDRSLRHPDVRVAFPETVSDFQKGHPGTEATSTGGIDLQAAQADAIAHPAWTLLIDRIRQGITFLQRGPAEAPRSVLILDQAHRMGAEAANALLKTLEEPPPHALILLLAASSHALLPTIRSRCQSIPFQLVPREAIALHLKRVHGLDPDEAALRAGLSGGRIGAALELDLDAYRARRDELVRLLTQILQRGDPGLAVARAEELSRSGDTVEADLEVLMTLLRDLLLLEASPNRAAFLVNVDIAPRLLELAAGAGDRLPGAIGELEGTLEGIRRRGNRQLLLEGFFLGLLPGAGAAASRPRPPA
jgi:DNA polymerase III subunit delta'